MPTFARGLDLRDPQFRADPYPHYRMLREADPVHWSDAAGAWILTRYDDVRLALTDARFAHWSERAGPLSRWLRLLDPRSGSALHAQVHPLFGPEAVRMEESRVRTDAESLIASIDTGTDAIGSFAEPLTARLAARLLGCPDAVALTSRVAAAFPALMAGHRSDVLDAFAAAIKERTADGLIGAVHRAKDQGDPIGEDDVVSFAVVFLFAAQENIRGFIGNALAALCRRPDAWALVRHDPVVLPRAVHELLRYDGPVQSVVLQARVDVELRGRPIRAGQSVLASVAAAGRDPEIFSDAEDLRLDRGDNPHLAFGVGSLYCAGSLHAQLVARIAIEVFARHFHSLEIDEGGVRWKDEPLVLRGPSALPVIVRRAG
jgi:cytochrome P450